MVHGHGELAKKKQAFAERGKGLLKRILNGASSNISNENLMMRCSLFRLLCKDQFDIFIIGEGLPFDDQNQSHYEQRYAANERGELHGVGGQTKEHERGIAGNRTDCRAGEHAEECEDVASDGVECNMGCRVFFGQIHVKNVRIGQIDTDIQEMLNDAQRNIHERGARRKEKVEELGRYPNQYRDAEGFNPRILSQQTSPEARGEQQDKRVHDRHGVDQRVRKMNVVQQVIAPDAVGDVRDVVPCKHEQHAQQEFAILEWQRENLRKLDVGFIFHRIFLRHRLNGDFDQNQSECDIAHDEDNCVLHGRTGNGIRNDTAEQQDEAGHDRSEDLLQRQITGSALVILGVKLVKPNGKARAKRRINRMRQEKDDDKPHQTRIRIGDELWHQRGCNDVHCIEIDLRSQKDGLAPLKLGKNFRRENAEQVGDVRNERDDACSCDGDAVHRQKACVENTGDEDVVE